MRPDPQPPLTTGAATGVVVDWGLAVAARLVAGSVEVDCGFAVAARSVAGSVEVDCGFAVAARLVAGSVEVAGVLTVIGADDAFLRVTGAGFATGAATPPVDW